LLSSLISSMPCTISSVIVSLCAPQLGPGNTDENDAQDESAASADSATGHWFGHALSTVVRGKASRRPHPRRKPATVVGAELDPAARGGAHVPACGRGLREKQQRVGVR